MVAALEKLAGQEKRQSGTPSTGKAEDLRRSAGTLRFRINSAKTSVRLTTPSLCSISPSAARWTAPIPTGPDDFGVLRHIRVLPIPAAMPVFDISPRSRLLRPRRPAKIR
jgi:hypothetical protein